jgi:hypothetical protein
MFIHDSLHTPKNAAFEMEQAASIMSPGGVMLVDDIGSHDSFPSFARRHPRYQTIICPSEDDAGIFGIAVKATTAGDPRRLDNQATTKQRGSASDRQG